MSYNNWRTTIKSGTTAIPDSLDTESPAILDEAEDASIKESRRNSKADQSRIQQVHDHTMALGALCADHNCPAPDPPERVATDGSAAPLAKKPVKKSIKADIEGQEPSDQAEDLGIPLDKLVSAVRDKFYDLRTDMRKAQAVALGKNPEYYYEWDDDECPCCEAVYDGYAIARVQLAFYKVPYTVEGTGIVLADQADWVQVKQDWVTKNADLLAILSDNRKQREVGAVKMLGSNRLGNYLMVWGDEKHRDLYGEFFTPETKGLKAIFDYIGKLPALYQHAMDGVVKYDPVGVIDVLEIDEVGLWMETQLDIADQYTDIVSSMEKKGGDVPVVAGSRKDNPYASAVRTLARKKALGTSSGALPGSRKVKANGEIVQWAIMEGSFTPTPAEPRLRELGVAEVKAIYEECGLEFPEDALKSDGIGGEEPRQEIDAAAVEEESLLLLELEAQLSV